MTREEFLNGLRKYGDDFVWLLNRRSVVVGHMPSLGAWLVECAEMYEGTINVGNVIIHGETNIITIPGEETVVEVA